MNVATESAVAIPTVNLGTRPFYWSVRRELWEHRTLWVAPLAAAALILLSFVVNALRLSGGTEFLAGVEPVRLRAIASGFYGAVGAAITLTMMVVTWFYCLDALYSERRDRSILFWKSLPVSDITTVASKLFVASVVAPAISFVIVVATQLVILLIGTAIIAFAGGSPAALWSSASLLQLSVVLLYALIAQAIWFSPVLAWMIFVSSWVRRSPTVWAALVPAAVCLAEAVAFGTSHVFTALKHRLMHGFVDAAFVLPASADAPARMNGPGFNLQLGLPGRIFEAVDPVRFLSNVEVWVGVAIAAALIAATVWMRRYREPL
jgi:ABC-2 type transport system permease protein